MSDTPIKRILTGKVIGYKSSLNILSSNAYVIVNADNDRIAVTVDSRQRKYIEMEYPPGSRIPIGFYEGKWNIGSKLARENTFQPETGVSITEVLNAFP